MRACGARSAAKIAAASPAAPAPMIATSALSIVVLTPLRYGTARGAAQLPTLQSRPYAG
jgi:hypothetical protein